MKTYVVEINDEAVLAFRAEDDDAAFGIVNEENGDLQLGLDVLRADGKPLWDGKSTISSRLATAAEHDEWLKVSSAEIGTAADGIQIDSESGEGPDDLNVYLIPVIDPDDDDEDGDDSQFHLLSEDSVKEIRASLDAAEKILYGYLDKSFGSYKKAPDDHPVFEALQSIKDVADHFSDED
jgi:hypothetical protein